MDLVGVGVVILVFGGIPVALVLLVIQLLRAQGAGRPAGRGRATRRTAAPSARGDLAPALTHVRERFARGEISEADYEAALRALGVDEPARADS